MDRYVLAVEQRTDCLNAAEMYWLLGQVSFIWFSPIGSDQSIIKREGS